jgi:hypothetical protein
MDRAKKWEGVFYLALLGISQSRYAHNHGEIEEYFCRLKDYLGGKAWMGEVHPLEKQRQLP